MTLAASNPWAAVIAGQAPMLEAQIASRHPDLAGIEVDAEGTVVTASVAAHPTPLDAVWRIAGELAPMWPHWLGDLDVGCVIAAGRVTVTAGPDAMAQLGLGWVIRPEWFDLTESTIG